MKHTTLLTLVTPALLCGALAFAGDDQVDHRKSHKRPKHEDKQSPKDEGDQAEGIDTSWLKVEGEANLDYFAKDSDNYRTNLRAQDAYVKMTADIAKGVRVAVKAQLDNALMVSGAGVAGSTFDIEQFIREAYIEIHFDEITGTPVAVIMGKGPMAFGQQLSHLPMFKDNLLYGANTIDQVVGITVALDKRVLGNALDSLEVSAFENGAGDLQIASGYGIAVRMSKQLAQGLKMTASGAAIEDPSKGNSSAWSDLEKRAALGLVYEGGKWRAFAQGVYIQGNASYPNSNWGVNAGTGVIVGPGEVVLEYTYLEKAAQQVALAYNLPLGENLTISPEVRYTFNQASGNPNDTQVGVRAKVKFNKHEEKKN